MSNNLGFSLLACLLLLSSCETKEEKTFPSFTTKFEITEGKETGIYEEVIAFYVNLAKDYPEINIQSMGETDSGFPLHVVTFNKDGDFNFQNIRENKGIILVNNGIHPGESDGIDATMMLFRDFAKGAIDNAQNVVIATIPAYNIGGMLNRNTTSRVNQNGPEAYGFRGNAQNYDLNRDFIKADTKNARSFAEIFHLIKPDVFIDNHVSNGADYQYTLTHLFTQHNKLGGELGTYLETVLRPSLEQKLDASGWSITPYVNVFNRSPEFGFSQFLDNPRYSTGYTTLWNTLGLMVETHMLKPYKQRVEGNYQLMKDLVDIVDKDYKRITELRTNSFEEQLEAKEYYFNFQIDTTKSSYLNFEGYELDTLTSEVTGLSRIKYNRDMPYEKEVVFQNYFNPKDTVDIPAAYIIKKGWHAVMERLKENKIEYEELESDTILSVESYTIESYKTYSNPYEGHYPHYQTKVTSNLKEVKFSAGDYLVKTNQQGLRYLLETLEPIAPDSFFNWNFFDTILQQKEGFSPYVFEDLALEILMQDEELKIEFLQKKEVEPDFASNWFTQLQWIRNNSKYKENAYKAYPVFRILKGSEAEAILN
ncbi:M14 family metallopeptidase [Croceivirga thetidis]|uniref:M14 family metallopeptidase n=1 Tax=Croceivirga thetidis TaxID=2721623 RepID=A0ABX1GUP2_9FLAO|nr:M14 family metallopeptidase [Croceivirga thetidis]NKI33378.1 M14 family metallopeptidase [Croceivirga thetidis]